MLQFSMSRRRMVALLAAAPFAPLPALARAQDGTPVTDQPLLDPLPDAASRADGPFSAIATTPILADFVRQIAGARAEVESILPVGADAHDFEPAPEDIVAIEDATLVFEHGLDLDSWASDLVETAGTDRVMTATDGVAVVASDGDANIPDPHVWFDPSNVKVMVATIASSLVGIDPDGQASYDARRDAYNIQLDALDAWIDAQIATIPRERRKLVTNHDAFGYFVRRYGLTFVGAVIPSIDSRAEPSAKEIADLIERIQAENVPAVFTETTINPELEEELAEQAGVAVYPGLYSDNLGDDGSGAETYIGMMVLNTRLIVTALRQGA